MSDLFAALTDDQLAEAIGQLMSELKDGSQKMQLMLILKNMEERIERAA